MDKNETENSRQKKHLQSGKTLDYIKNYSGLSKWW